MTTTATHYLEVNAPADRCYQWWRPLTHLPEILDDVESVEPKSGDADVTHWVVEGPLGKKIEWDAKIIDEETDRKIAWKSLEESNNQVETGGAVRFDNHGDSHRRRGQPPHRAARAGSSASWAPSSSTTRRRRSRRPSRSSSSSWRSRCRGLVGTDPCHRVGAHSACQRTVRRGRRWHVGHQYDDRLVNDDRTIAVPQRRHGSSSRPYTASDRSKYPRSPWTST